ncbi:endosomal/lysosomal proton channel TMEM175 isoform X1 [Gorilla gorilla gorilla]|uniref:Endosomal/lysosomal proton channel TMEM175 n=3 Tax=Gorilla gorilla gorilla TaxID=9595 RepID=G3R453_GORGO|nr:endosomal/lysosomal proton channel TMEM175 isoform X1 [Gorilla gorilla gorilla]XP_055240266.1 endosomal/lysosomal proton channel TMEM175 isoform X1 [Gorilla gorilla gorilla]XP_055240267.1 endosomal/lysosomal proton channel TMEM175 isoform X1 [Gorilla gorilla gorilla]XP_055240268.1 endosomal/lysosomal proton channel TMEM175 isoform X1 [Gorilla gorilla gorilla]
MSQPRTPEQALDTPGDCPPGRRDEDAGEGIQCSQRMLSFSDALLSIIATVMILPVTHTEISPEQQFDRSVQRLLATRIAVYLMTFLIVTVAWAAHTRLFQVVGKTDDTLALLNLACMMTITFLPYTFSLMVTFPDVPLGIFLFCVCVITIGVVQALIVGYAFHFPHLLSPQIQRSAHRALYRRHVLGIVLQGPALCFAAAIFSLFFVPLSYLLMVTVILLPYVSKVTGWCRDRLLGRREPAAHPVEVFSFDLHEPLSKERVEAFSDGVYAIVATLLILDICEDNVPDPKDVKERFGSSLVAALSAAGPRFLAYFGSFATVGLLWFAHHSLFLHVRKATRAMGLLNTLSLAFVGGLPLAYQQTSAFARQPRDELERVRVSCTIIFLASIFQLAMWTTALLHQAETLQPSVWFGGREHVLMFAKLALYPCASLLAFASTCLLSRFSVGIFHLMQIAVPCAFLLLRLLVGLALATLQVLRGLARPGHPPPAPTGQDDPQSQLLPAPC